MPVTSNVAYWEWALKEKYEPYLTNLFFRDKVLLETLERSSDYVDVTGKYLSVPLLLGANQSHGVLGEYDTAPAPRRSIGTQARYTTVQQYFLLQISGRAIHASASAEGAWQNIKTLEVESLMEAKKQDLNRQLYGDGSGALASCGAASTVTTIPVSKTQYLFETMLVDFIDSATGTPLALGRDITAVDEATGTITISGEKITTTTGHVVCRSGSHNAEIDGLAKIVAASGAVGDVNPATPGYRNWKAYRDATGGSVSVPRLQQAFQHIQTRGGKAKLLIAGQITYNAMATYLEAQKRIPVEGTAKLPGGMTGVLWNGIEMFMDIDCPSTTLYILDPEAIKFGEVGAAGWISEPDGEGRYSLLHWIPRTNIYEGLWAWDMNLITIARNRLAAIDNLS